jgi:tetratricopeptide (TPR) repeat protein
MAPPQSLPDTRVIADDHTRTLELALDRHQAGEREEAERLYLEVLAADPREPTALYLYGLFSVEAGRMDAAERLLKDVVELRPDVADGHLALGDLHKRCGRQGEAIAAYRAVLAIQPGHPSALLNLMSLIIERGLVDADFDDAAEVCRAAIGLLPDPAPAHAVLGRILLSSGRGAEAVEAYRAAAALAPANPAAFAGLALALLLTGEGDAALEAADAALTLQPDQRDGWFARGNALLMLHRAEAAAGAFEQAVALAPGEARMHLGLGDAYAELDRNAEALAHLSRAVALDPDSKWAHANLGSMLYRCGQLDEAERRCRKALALDPRLPIAHRNLAGILGDRGAFEEAKRHRDTAYGLRNLEIELAARAAANVLVLTTADSGNIPHRHLLPKDRYTRIEWFIEYAHEGQAAELPPYDIVFNIIGDPDYADATEAPVAAFLRICDRPVLNDPAKVARTRRDRLPDLLGDIEGVVAPKVARLDPAACPLENLPAWVEASGLSAPVLVRPIGSHGGKGMQLARTPAELAAIEVAAGGAYATEFVDYRSPADGRYRKYRVIFVDRTPYPYHLAVKDDWLVHYYSSEMTGDAARQAEELRFLQDPLGALGATAMAAVAAIGARLDLDYAGVDFSVLPDGRVLVFEANATMLVHPERNGEFAYKNPYVARITAAFRELICRRSR